MNWCSDIAGILLLNVGNGIPDLITSLLIIEEEPFILIATSIGSFIFLLTISLSSIILSSKKRNFLDFGTFYKNTFVLIFSFSVYVYLMAAQTLFIFLPIILLISYGLFIYYSLNYSLTYNDTLETIIEDTETKKGILHNTFQIIKIPFRIIFDILTLNEKNSKNYGYIGFLISPIMNFFLYYMYQNIQTKYKHFSKITFSCILFGFFLCLIYKFKKSNFIFSIYSFASSCFLLYIFTSDIVNFIEFSSKNLKIPKELSAILLLPLGNSFGDLITGMSASRQGLFRTAANACMSAPIHNTLFNFSIISLLMLYKNEFKSINVYHNNIINVAMCLGPFILINIILNFEIKNRKLESELAYVLIFMYAVFVGFTVMEYYW
ncbi:hypothetical protein GVAV_000702 [Gurleya vavrai]